MHKPLTVLLIAGLFLSSCGWRDSRVNPGNWFGKGRSVAAETQTDAVDVNPLIPIRSGIFAKKKQNSIDNSVPVEIVSQLRIERTASGAIIHATGIGAREGLYGVHLTPDNPDDLPIDGVLSYTFSGLYPTGPTPLGTERTRRVNVALSLSNQQLQGVRKIRVSGTQNAREARRR